jgi:putative acetyltransferase
MWRMTVTIERADFSESLLAAFLQAHLDELEPTAPPESRHALDLARLQAPGVRLWVARDETGLVGTAALAALEAGHEELKSMRTDPARRRTGVGARLLDHLLHDARSRGVRRISLETGSTEFFGPARAMYAAAGFVPCGPFGSYTEDHHSIYLSRLL